MQFRIRLLLHRLEVASCWQAIHHLSFEPEASINLSGQFLYNSGSEYHILFGSSPPKLGNQH